MSASRCDSLCPCGPNGELLGCGFKEGHDGDHAWASLPTFISGLTLLEKAAVEYVEAGAAEAERVVRTRKATDPKSPEWGRKQDAHLVLIAASAERLSGLVGDD